MNIDTGETRDGKNKEMLVIQSLRIENPLLVTLFSAWNLWVYNGTTIFISAYGWFLATAILKTRCYP